MKLPKVAGFRFAGIHAGIKRGDDLDLALAASDVPVPAAAVFTKNLVRAAPVDLAEARVRSAKVRAILVNSGNANACTGKEGMRDALESTEAVARALGAPADSVLPASTGVVGHRLPAGVIAKAAPALVDALDERGAASFARAILTTDRSEKVAHRVVKVDGGRATLLGICKGAGMIHPNMATTLGFVFTDARLTKGALSTLLRRGADATFNRVSVDGDTSTNDMLALLASGRTGDRLIAGSAAMARFEKALVEVLDALAMEIVADGEGAEHAVRVEVKGAANASDADKVARAIATSPLVKTALHGCDPNWGRIVAAAGRSGARFDPTKVSVRIGGVTVCRGGRGVMDKATEARASAVMKAPRYAIVIRLGAGDRDTHYVMNDLGHEYVRINADYRS